MSQGRRSQRKKKKPDEKARKPGEKFRRISSTEEGAEFSSPYSDDNVYALPEMDDSTNSKLTVIMDQLKKLNVLDSINERLGNIEKDISVMRGKISDLEDAQEFLSNEIKSKTSTDDFEKLVAQVDDLSNRVRRKNLVFINVPEGAEGDNEGDQAVKCEVFVKKFITEYLKLDAGNIVIERAHRTPMKLRQPRTSPRPIHIAFLSFVDRQRVLNAAKNLKDNPYPGATVIVAEDLTPKLQAERKKLWKKRMDLLKEKKGRKVFVNYPAILRIVEPDGTSRQLKASEI
jgi:uncharacterized protein YoxC